MSKSVIQLAYGFVDGALFENEFSKVSFESIFFDVFAYCTLILEQIFDQHKIEIDTALYEQKSGTPRWYRNMALSFQYGFRLLTDSDKFDNTGFTIDQIEVSKIIKYCSVKESGESNQLVVKVAGESSGYLIPLTNLQLDSFDGYMEKIKYAGVKLSVVNNPADRLILNMTIYRDVMLIDDYGNNIAIGGKPVENAIRSYMKALPFDGELVINDLIEKLRAVPGVLNANIISANSSYWDEISERDTEFMPINVKTIPMSGYFEAGSISLTSGLFESGNFRSVNYVV